MRKPNASAVFFCLLLFLSAAAAPAQVNTSATLRGTVTDKSGAVAPGAEIRINEKETGLTRTTTSNDSGGYRFDLLPAGHYDVRVSLSGFSTVLIENVELIVGQNATADASLTPSAQAETVTVEANMASVLVDTQKTDVGRAITPSEVQSLPLNGRDFVNLAILAPGARPVPSYDPTKARIGVFATNGSSGRNVNMTINGIDNKDGTVGGPVMQLPLEAIDEFNISTQRFSAANGRSEGAAVNVVTKAGTNNYHGVLYFFDREAAFNALNYFEEQPRGNGQKADFSRQQFGGSVGGPIKKDKTFIFFALERAREQTSLNVTGTAYNQISILAANGFNAVPVHSIPTPYFDWRYNGRLDHRINDKNNLSMSYSNQNNNGLNDQATATVDGTATNFTTNQLIVANVTLNSVLTPSIVNSATAGYQYWHNLIDTNEHAYQFAFPSASIGQRGAVPQESFQKKWQFKDDIVFNHGNHSIKAGADYLWEPLLGGILASSIAGIATFFDDPDVITTNKTKYPQGFSTPGAITSIVHGTSGNPYFYEPAKMFGVYGQDDWKVRRNLTLNIGLRWDRDYNLNAGSSQKDARAYLYLKQIGDPLAGGLPHDDTKDFSPRVGVAWDVRGNAKHVVRAGYGLYYGQPFINITLFMLQQTTQYLYTTVSLSNNVVPGSTTGGTSDIVPTTGLPLSQFRYGIDPLPTTFPASTQLTGASTVGRIIDPKYRNPYTQQWSGGYTYALTPNSSIEVEYVHVLSLHESKSVYINPVINGVRYTTPLFAKAGINYSGPIQAYQPSGRSRYDGLNFSYRRRMTKHFSLNSTYVLSRGLAYNGNAGAFGNVPTDFNNYFAAHDLGPTPADETHRVTVSGLADLPFGIKVAPIMQWASGRPYNVTEGITDVYGFGTGAAATHAIVLNDQPNNLLATVSYTATQLQACLAASTCHQVPYDYLRGAAFFQLDMRVSRVFNIPKFERGKIELMFQAFDLTNRANFGANYQGNIRSATFQQPTNFITGSGTIVPKSFSGEFGARFSF
jgi:hypothetical protein